MGARRGDVSILRDLARQYAEIAVDPIQEERRRLWREKNSLRPVRPLIYVRAFAFNELPESRLHCEDPFWRGIEALFRSRLLWHTFEDDSIFEPWITVRAAYNCTGWGVSGERKRTDAERGSWKMDYPIQELGDIKKLRTPWHEINEQETARRENRAKEALGDLLAVDVDRAPAYRMWSADLSTDLGYLRGIENFMMDMIDHPSWLHGLLAFMRDGVLRTHQQAEEAGDWGLSAHQNQAMPYALELQDPAPNVRGVKRRELWTFAAAQEMTLISPEMHEEFVLRYQIPILEHFGLVAYGCCEDLSRKIDILRKIPRLRRIAVAPAADVGRCAEQIGTEYVLSYRPSPTDMVGYGLDASKIKNLLREDFKACQGCHFDVTLKDVETVQGDVERIRRFVRIVKDLIEEMP